MAGHLISTFVLVSLIRNTRVMMLCALLNDRAALPVLSLSWLSVPVGTVVLFVLLLVLLSFPPLEPFLGNIPTQDSESGLIFEAETQIT